MSMADITFGIFTGIGILFILGLIFMEYETFEETMDRLENKK
ncbi:MAG: hypothetical protein AABY32_01020 [Nanoarchaeota archaeon]